MGLNFSDMSPKEDCDPDDCRILSTDGVRSELVLDGFLTDDFLPRDSKNCVALNAKVPILAVLVPD